MKEFELDSLKYDLLKNIKPKYDLLKIIKSLKENIKECFKHDMSILLAQYNCELIYEDTYVYGFKVSLDNTPVIDFAFDYNELEFSLLKIDGFYKKNSLQFRAIELLVKIMHDDNIKKCIKEFYKNYRELTINYHTVKKEMLNI